MPGSQFYGSLTKTLYEIWPQKSLASHRNELDDKCLLVSATKTASTATTATTESDSHPPNHHSQQHEPNRSSSSSTDNNGVHHRLMTLTEIQQMFHSVELYPTESQVYEMICCARGLSSRGLSSKMSSTGAGGEGHILSQQPNSSGLPNTVTGTNGSKAEYLTFGEFCFFASVLYSSYQQNSNNVSQPNPSTQSDRLDRRLERVQEINASMMPTNWKNDTKFDIFLGGSCNPTCWRSEVVIPELKKQAITYYNPQVDHWGPELIELESYAKQNSEVLFFVVDNQTRAIASMIEVAFIASTDRKLILVINDLTWPHCKIGVNGTSISAEEYQSLHKGRQYLRDIVERQGIPIFNDISIAVKSAVRVLRENIFPQQLTLKDHVIPVKMGQVCVGDKIIHMFKVFESLKNVAGVFTFAELRLAYRTLTGRDLSEQLVQDLAQCHLDTMEALEKKALFEVNNNTNMNNQEDLNDSTEGRMDSLPPLDRIVIDFERFCCIFSELTAKSMNNQLVNGLIKSGQDGTDEHHDLTTTTVARIKPTSNPIESSGRFQLLVNKVTNVFSIMKSMYSNSIANKAHHNDDEQFMVNNGYEYKPTQDDINTHFVDSNRLVNNSYLVNNNNSSSNVNSFYQPSLFRQQQQQQHQPNGANNSTYMMSERSSQNIQYSRRNTQHYPNFPDQSIHYPMVNRQPQSAYRRQSYNLSTQSFSSTVNNSFRAYRKNSFSGNGNNNNSTATATTNNIISNTSAMFTTSFSTTSLVYEQVYDLYIGGCVDEHYLNTTIVPMLKKHTITYSTLKFDKLANERMIPLEAENIAKNLVLLFLIRNNTLDISTMILAAHFMGYKKHVVLCIEQMEPKQCNLNEEAIKDYNRGRAYLSDLATKVGVPVFSKIPEAINCCVEIFQSKI